MPGSASNQAVFSRQGFLSVLLVAAAALFSVQGCSRRASSGHNVLIIVSDALRKDILGCYGGPARTPNIDRMADGGVLFERAYSTAPSTLPSSVAMLTGNYSRCYIAATGKEGDLKHPYYVNEGEHLLAEALADLGYEVLVDTENGLAGRSNNLQGFESLGHMTSLSPEEIRSVEGITGIRLIGRHENPHLSSKYDKSYSLLHFLMNVPDDQNFFVLKWFSDPHAPYFPPKKFRSRIDFDPEALSREEEFFSIIDSIYSSRDFSEADVAYLKRLYRAEVESIDERVGFIWKALEHNGLSETTYVVFTSDHGELFGEHGRLLHDSAFHEPLVNVPLIICGPNLPRGERVEEAVSLVGLMPTLSEILRVDRPLDFQGSSFASWLLKNRGRSQDVYLDRISNKLEDRNLNSDALLRNGYKLKTVERNGKAGFVLFDLAADPVESRDVSTDHPGIVREMYRTIRGIRAECEMRARDNLREIGRDVDLEEEAEKTMEELKALGYIK